VITSPLVVVALEPLYPLVRLVPAVLPLALFYTVVMVLSLLLNNATLLQLTMVVLEIRVPGPALAVLPLVPYNIAEMVLCQVENSATLLLATTDAMVLLFRLGKLVLAALLLAHFWAAAMAL
jgi:hypothetical protein